MSARLRILGGNGHNEDSIVGWLRSSRWDAAAVSEVDRLTKQLQQIPGTRTHVTTADYDRARDTAVLVRDAYPSLGWKAAKVSRALGRRGSALRRVAPPRTLVEAQFEHPVATELGLAGVCVIVVHPDAGPEQLTGLNPRAPIVREYRRAWAAARRAWREARRDGYLVVLVSDAQMTARSRRPWSPRVQARRMRAKTWSTRIDWIFYDRRLVMSGAPVTHRLHDHTGFIATLVARTRRQRRRPTPRKKARR